MDTTDVLLTRIIGAIIAFFGLAGLVMAIADQLGGGTDDPIFDILVPVLFLLIGIWLFRVARLRQPVSWHRGLGVLLVFLGLSSLALCLDQLLVGRSPATVFGFLLGAVMVAGGLLLGRSASQQRSS